MWDELLQQEFSPTRGMFDVQPVSGTKIAVTTTVGRPMLLVNYRRTSHIQSDYYHAHEAKNADEEPKLWQCARATSAAPIFFPPIDLPGIGTCEDGGLKQNNPAPICRAEIQLMWPSRPLPATL
ncbi:hypothetical protein KXX35_003157, partial [Aspergillus fumigatus]